MKDARFGVPMLLTRRGEAPLFRQISEHFRAAIRAGQLRPGDRLPSARFLAEAYAVARGTIDAAYAMLAGEGYVVSRGPGGTVVSPSLTGIVTGRRSAKHPVTAEPPLDAPSSPRPFQLGLPALDAFPRKLWSRCVARRARALAAADLAYPPTAGLPILREAVASYLGSSRGVQCTARQVLITRGYPGALELIISTVLREGERACIEDPCYPLTRDRLQIAGVEGEPPALAQGGDPPA